MIRVCKWVIGVSTFIIEANHKKAIVTVIKRKSGYAVMTNFYFLSKTIYFFGILILEAPKPYEARVKTLIYDNGKELNGGATGLMKRWVAQ